MSLMIPIFIVIVIFLYVSKKEIRWIKYGNYQRSKHIKINQHKYYLEEVIFKDFHKAIHHYFKIVADIAAYDDTLEVKYDYNDWSNTIFRFEHTTIKLVRCVDKVQLIKSSNSISVEDFELDNPEF